MEFRIGDRVGINLNRCINLSDKEPHAFVRSMRLLLGRTATIQHISKDGRVILTNWSDGSGKIDWKFCTGMLKLVHRFGEE